MKKKIKKILLFACAILAVLILLNFIPVKIAKKPQKGDTIYNDTCKIGIGEEDDYKALVRCEYNLDESRKYYEVVKIIGNTPYTYLNKNTFDKISLFSRYSKRKNGDGIIYNTTNFYYIYGKKTGEFKTDIGETVMVINVDEWDILYPIQRHGFRRHIASTGYLTIYDYDWGNVFKSWISRLKIGSS